MNTSIKRFVLACAFALTALVASSSQARAVYILQPGIYFARCDGVYLQVYNILGSHLGRLHGFLCIGHATIRIIVNDRVQLPNPPQQNPPGHSVWQGMNAVQWVNMIRDTFVEAPGEPITASDLRALQENPPPTLTCNVAHFDPPPAD